MTDRILIVERDATDATVWRYGLADAEELLSADARRLRHDLETGSVVPVGEAEMLVPTALLLVRQAGDRDRVVYDLAFRPVERGSDRSQPPSEQRWERSTAKRRRGPRATLGQRAERDRRGGPRPAP